MLRMMKKGIEKAIGFLTRIILYVAYFIGIAPFALVVRLCTDYLRLRSQPAWEDSGTEENVERFMEKQ